MTKVKQIYKCDVCGNVVEVLHDGVGTLVCCNQNMTLQEEHNQDAGLEKHVPVIEENANIVKVKIGSVDHPMENDHFIEWIELCVDGKVYRQHLTPDDKPEATFELSDRHIEISARAYCNIHGLWKN
jgi:superoxide reductase